ncbi:MAG: hypothetical protein ACK5YG_16040, partial [Alphaproteobacteria bacterium]
MTPTRIALAVGLAGLAAVALVYWLVLAPGGAGGDVPNQVRSRQDVEQIVRNYLLENPEVIFEAARRMEQK